MPLIYAFGVRVCHKKMNLKINLNAQNKILMVSMLKLASFSMILIPNQPTQILTIRQFMQVFFTKIRKIYKNPVNQRSKSVLIWWFYKERFECCIQMFWLLSVTSRQQAAREMIQAAYQRHQWKLFVTHSVKRENSGIIYKLADL